MLKALLSTITELLDSKKAAYSFIASLGACILHLYFKIDPEVALLLVSPLGVATLSQAHVDAAAAKHAPPPTSPAVTEPATPSDPAPAPATPSDDAATKVEG